MNIELFELKNPESLYISGFTDCTVFYTLHSEVVEIALDPDYRGALVAGTGGEVAQGSQKVGQLPGGGALGGHVAYKVGILCLYGIGDGVLKGVSGQVRVVVVGQILKLKLVGLP